MWALVGAVGVLLLISWQVEVAAAARLLPPPAARFGSGQPVTVPLAAGESRTVYWDFQNVRRGARATAECRVSDAQSRAELPRQKVGGDLRVNNWNALVTFTAARAGSVEVECLARGAASARFVVGAPVPAPRPLSGVSDYSGGAAGLMLVALCFLVPTLLVLAVVPVKPIVRVWVFDVWAPLLIATLLVLTLHSTGNALMFWVLWFCIRWYRRRRR